MNRLTLLAVLVLAALSARAETMQQWVDAAPQAEVEFSPWQRSTNTYGEGLRLAQGIYGYVDLSKLPEAEFPIRARFLHTPVQVYPMGKDATFRPDHTYALPTPDATALPPRYVDEAVIRSPGGAAAVPVWNSPFIISRWSDTRYDSEMENVRLEVIGRSGALLARRLIGASTWNRMLRRSVVVNSPEMAAALSASGVEAISVPSLVPDDYALLNVEAVWIDSSVVQDSALTDAYWRRVLLGGCVVAGHPEDVAALASRLALSPGGPVLNGRLLSCETPAEVTREFKPNPPNSWTTTVAIASDDNPFYFSVDVGKVMNLQLISFSRWYLGIFLVLQVALIFIAFTQVRGQRRVWLWLVVPLFAILYSIIGGLLAGLFMHYRAEAEINQIERQHEGWPEALMITKLSYLDLNGGGMSVHFPSDSRPAWLSGTLRFRDPGGDLVFHHDEAGSQLDFAPLPARKQQMFVRSWIPARAPILVAKDGTITPQRAFSGAWLWDGTNWRDLGPLRAGDPVALSGARPFSPGLSYLGDVQNWQANYDDDFPGLLKPLLLPATTSALAAVGEGLFFGVESAGDCVLDRASSYLVHSRRVIAYQFHLPKAQL